MADDAVMEVELTRRLQADHVMLAVAINEKGQLVRAKGVNGSTSEHGCGANVLEV